MGLLQEYGQRKSAIKNRLGDFRTVMQKSEEDVYEELVFCLLTPQSKARTCDRAVKKLREKGLLTKGSADEVRAWLAGVRFPNEKAKHVVGARALFINGNGIALKSKLGGDPRETREWLVRNVKGYGYKEASHFLRNVGLGFELAILDRHILKNLVRYNAIDEIPKSLTPKKYMEIEEKMRQFAAANGIPMAELDLLFWSMEAGEIFK